MNVLDNSYKSVVILLLIVLIVIVSAILIHLLFTQGNKIVLSFIEKPVIEPISLPVPDSLLDR